MKKFSVIDVLITIILILIIAFGVIKFKDIISAKGGNQTVRFSVLATKVNSGTGDFISIGDEVSISLKEKAYAKVIGVEETEHYEDKFSENLGKYSSQPVEGESDILLELECDAKVTDTEILNGNVPIRVGEESYIHGKGYSLHGFIVVVDDSQK